VVLDACSTEKDPGESALASESLVHYFVDANVPHVVATRWNVDSASSAALMRAFYTAMLVGRRVPEALAIAETEIGSQSPHPYYWAAFDAFGK